MKTAKTHHQIIDTSTEVSHQEKLFLLHGSRKFPIHAECASKYSIFFHYIENHSFTDLNKPVSLLIQNNGDSVELGPCRVLSGSGSNGYSGRIVFTENVCDIQSLLLKNKVIKLQSSFNDLPLILDRKRNICQPFKEYTSDLVYDLSVYKKSFDDLDWLYQNEPVEVKKSIQKVLLEKEGYNFIQFLNEKLFKIFRQMPNKNIGN